MRDPDALHKLEAMIYSLPEAGARSLECARERVQQRAAPAEVEFA